MLIRKQRQQEFLDFMVWFVKMYEVNTYVELGVYRGYTFNTIAPLVKRAIGIDPVGYKVVSSPTIKFFQMTATEFVKQWQGQIDLLFIDANHAKESVLNDMDLLSPFVTEGTGFILLHDTHPVVQEQLAPGYCGTAWEAAWEIRTNPKYDDFEIVTFPGPWAGMSIIRKSKTQLCWTPIKPVESIPPVEEFNAFDAMQEPVLPGIELKEESPSKPRRTKKKW